MGLIDSQYIADVNHPLLHEVHGEHALRQVSGGVLGHAAYFNYQWGTSQPGASDRIERMQFHILQVDNRVCESHDLHPPME
jgi:hypothetical protein